MFHSMYNPIGIGFNEVRTKAFLDSFQSDWPSDYLSIPDGRWSEVRRDAMQGLAKFEKYVKQSIRQSVKVFMNNDRRLTWNATRGDSIRTNVAHFMDLSFGAWNKEYMRKYKTSLRRLPVKKVVKDQMAMFVLDFIDTAKSRVPYVPEDNDWSFDSHSEIGDSDPDD